MFHQFNIETGSFPFNRSVSAEFVDYCFQIEGKKYNSSVVTKALNTLVKYNLILNISKGVYLFNPVVIGGVSFSIRKQLIETYSNYLVQKGKDPVQHF